MGTPPVITAPTISVTVTEQATPDYKEQARQAGVGTKDSSLVEKFWAVFWASVADGVGTLLEYAARVAGFYLAKILKLMLKLQGDETPEFYDLAAPILSDITDVEIDAATLREAKFGKGRVAVYNKIGEQIVNLLAHDLITPGGKLGVGLKENLVGSGIGGLPTGTLSPDQGVEAARRFLGFAISQAIQGANMALLGEVATFGQVEHFSKYADGVARSLALERQSRAALRPLIDTMIATPLEWALAKQYRPTLLSVNDVTRAYFAGLVSEADALEELARRGLSTAKINALLELEQKRIGVSDVEQRLRWGLWDRATGVDYLRKQGWTPEGAELALQGVELGRIERRAEEFVNVLQAQALDGFISLREYFDQMDALPLGPTEKQFLRLVVSQRVEVPRKALSTAQLQEAVVQGVITIAELEADAVKDGFSPDDVTVLKILTLLRLARFEEAEKEREERKKRNPPPPPPPPAPTPVP